MLYVKEYKNLTFRLKNQDHTNIRYSMTKLFSTKNFIFLFWLDPRNTYNKSSAAVAFKHNFLVMESVKKYIK